MHENYTMLAANIQKFRKQRKLTQEELAQKLGVTFQAVSKWETAKAAPDIFLLPLMAEIFGCTIDRLFAGAKRKSIRIDKIFAENTFFDASYFGEIDRSFISDSVIKLEFWRLENTGSIFNNCIKTLDVLPYNNYPSVDIEIGQVFVVDCHLKNGSVQRKFYLADGTIWRGMPSTREIVLKNDDMD